MEEPPSKVAKASEKLHDVNTDLSATKLETQFGIECYISEFSEVGCHNTEAVDGILKHRYSDFIVNEVDASDNVVRLTSLKLPDSEEPKWNEIVFFLTTINCIKLLIFCIIKSSTQTTSGRRTVIFYKAPP